MVSEIYKFVLHLKPKATSKNSLSLSLSLYEHIYFKCIHVNHPFCKLPHCSVLVLEATIHYQHPVSFLNLSWSQSVYFVKSYFVLYPSFLQILNCLFYIFRLTLQLSDTNRDRQRFGLGLANLALSKPNRLSLNCLEVFKIEPNQTKSIPEPVWAKPVYEPAW